MSTLRAEAMIKWMNTNLQQQYSLQKAKTHTKGYEDEMGDDVADLVVLDVPGNNNIEHAEDRGEQECLA